MAQHSYINTIAMAAALSLILPARADDVAPSPPPLTEQQQTIQLDLLRMLSGVD